MENNEKSGNFEELREIDDSLEINSNNENSEDKNITHNNEIKQTLPISKNQLKKMKKREFWEKTKKEKRKAEKQKQKEKKKKLREEQGEPKQPEICLPRKMRNEQYLQKVNEGITLMIDCDFESLMCDKDIISMTRQISDCYSTNRKADKPFNFVLYDLDQKLYDNLNKNNYQNWIGVSSVKKATYSNVKEYNKNKEVIYLTADSDNEITELDSNTIYLIGGIVDRNRYKQLTFNKANELGIKHAKLPIGDYINLKSSKVLATNHVFSILSYFVNTKSDWKEAFMSIIPKRKFD